MREGFARRDGNRPTLSWALGIAEDAPPLPKMPTLSAVISTEPAFPSLKVDALIDANPLKVSVGVAMATRPGIATAKGAREEPG